MNRDVVARPRAGNPLFLKTRIVSLGKVQKLR